MYTLKYLLRILGHLNIKNNYFEICACKNLSGGGYGVKNLTHARKIIELLCCMKKKNSMVMHAIYLI